MIKLHKPYLGIEEYKAIKKTLDSSDIASGGKAEKKFQEDLRRFFGIKYVVTTPSGTAALELAVASLGLDKGDEVLVPSFTFPSDATAVLLQNATAKFVEVEPIFLI